MWMKWNNCNFYIFSFLEIIHNFKVNSAQAIIKTMKEIFTTSLTRCLIINQTLTGFLKKRSSFKINLFSKSKSKIVN